MIGFINKFQMGGAAQQQIDEEVASVAQVMAAVMQKQGKQVSAEELYPQILQLKNSDPQKYQQIVQQAKQYAQQAQSMKIGGHLAYLRKLNTGCPEGTVPYYYKKGGPMGRMCKECVSAQEMKCGGKSKKKMECGGGAPKKRVYFDKCGKKIKK